jgi:hypothetical protein
MAVFFPHEDSRQSLVATDIGIHMSIISSFFGLLPHKTFYIILFSNLSYLMLFEKRVVRT